jgi:hypothetical protein
MVHSELVASISVLDMIDLLQKERREPYVGQDHCTISNLNSETLAKMTLPLVQAY